MQVTEVEADQVCENVALQSQATNLDVKSDSVQKSPIRKCEPCEHGTTRTLDKWTHFLRFGVNAIGAVLIAKKHIALNAYQTDICPPNAASNPVVINVKANITLIYVLEEM